MTGRDEKIRSIRNTIQQVEDVKDKILRYWETRKKLDASTRNMWESDAKDAYFTVVASWEMLEGAAQGSKENAESSKELLSRAKSALERCASELAGMKEGEALRLEAELRKAHEQCRAEIFSQLLNYLNKKETVPLSQKTVKISGEEVHLLCGACGDIAAKFKVGMADILKETKLIYSGITTGLYIDLVHSEKIFKLLNEENPGAVHAYIRENTPYQHEGMDAYCPECDKIYCREHYNPVEEYDDGFYDCTYGTCPSGHRRMIDD